MDIRIGEDVLDSRDVEDRISDLEDILEGGEWNEENSKFLVDGVDYTEEVAEQKFWMTLRNELENYCPDWRWGTTIMLESYFTEHAKEYAEDIGAYDPDAGWPLSFIDWDAAAEALKVDYTEATVTDADGCSYTYLAR